MGVFAIFPTGEACAVDRREWGFELSTGVGEYVRVTDESSAPPDFDALAAEARRAAIDAMKNLEQTAWRRGFNEGFMAGWEAGQKRIREMMAEAAPQPALATVVPEAPALPLFPESPSPPTVRASDVVGDIIRANPGIRGVDIVKAAADAGQPILERTVRTALYRMKRDRQIKNLGGKWFAADAVPDEAGSNDGGENDA